MRKRLWSAKTARARGSSSSCPASGSDGLYDVFINTHIHINLNSIHTLIHTHTHARGSTHRWVEASWLKLPLPSAES